MPNKLDQFWQELKRRNVVRVITVYAGAAFVIIELINNITEPLRLPEWTPTLVIVLLAIGFPIVIIISWIYDVHPEGGLEKTQPADKIKTEDIPKSSNSWKVASYISFAVIVGLIIFNILSTGNKSGTSSIREKSIAILPFANLSEDKGNEYFADGLVDDLLNRISVIEDLKVISRTSSEMYRERGVKTVPQIAEELNVAYILEGSVQRYGNNARITVQLIDARKDNHVWAKTYDRDIDDVFQTQSEIATHIATELDAILTSKQKAIILKDKTSNVEAFELYQMGRFYWNKRTGDGFRSSIEYFEQAIEKDPGYGLAYAGLADSYILMALQGHIDPQEGRDRAEELALKALELDANLAEAYAVLGEIYDYADWNWGKAEEMYQHALALNPNYSTAHHYYSEHLSIIGRHEEARVQINKAKELNPLSFVIRYVSAKLFLHQGEFEDALRELVICDEIQEGHPWTDGLRWQACWLLGSEDETYQAYRNVLSTFPVFELDIADSIYNSSGFSGVLNWVVDRNISFVDKDRNYASIASDLAFLGRYEEAMEWLEKAYQFHQVSEQVFQIQFKPLHDNPRFQAILEGMGLMD